MFSSFLFLFLFALRLEFVACIGTSQRGGDGYQTIAVAELVASPWGDQQPNFDDTNKNAVTYIRRLHRREG